MNEANDGSGDWAARTRHNTIRLAFWTGAWVITMAVAVFGPQLVWGSSSSLTVLAVAANVLVGFGMIVANKTHLKGLDEMQQRIQLEAMAIALGVGLVLGLAYSAADTTNLIAFDAEISHLVMLIGLTYLAGIFFGHRNYR